ncbi:MAG: 4'-phosphopantetheinyl transferase superfamily protein [Hyphomicrobiales bacterium]|nr:4'-phosphopantetheinyl transferase superfamily protein [Hyphomicrobiales bacterium]
MYKKSDRFIPSCVGLLDVSALPATLWERSAQTFLSATELAVLGTIRHARRRQEWISGRALAKYLVLSGAFPCNIVRMVGIDQLMSVPIFEYREVDVLPNRDGAPEMWRRETLMDRALSLSHAGGWVAAALLDEGSIGIDCEVIQARHQAFLNDSFVEAERKWVKGHVVADGPSVDCLYTLLWSFKEAALKTGRMASPRAINIRLRTDSDFPVAAFRRLQASSRELISLDWRVNGLAPRFAFTACLGWVLSLVHFPRLPRYA